MGNENWKIQTRKCNLGIAYLEMLNWKLKVGTTKFLKQNTKREMSNVECKMENVLWQEEA